MENLGAIADSRYTGFREITDLDVLELHCSSVVCPSNLHVVECECIVPITFPNVTYSILSISLIYL